MSHKEDLSSEAKRVAERLKESLDKTSTSVLTLMGTDEISSFVLAPDFISTQNTLIDIKLGGGIPTGRIIELFSSTEGAGKSTLCAHIIAEAQRTGGLAILIDSEHGSVVSRLEQLGVDTEALVYVDPESIEDVLKVIEETIKAVKDSGVADKTLIVWDSLAATPTRARMEEGAYEATARIGEVARIMSHHLPRISRVVGQARATLIVVNQGREKINVMYGEKTTTSGGKALKFHCDMRIKIDAVSKIKSGGGTNTEIVGITSKLHALKNRMQAPYQSASLDIRFDSGMDVVRGFIDGCIEAGVVKQSGAWYSVEGVDKKIRYKDIPAALAGLDDPSPAIDKLIAAGANSNFVSYFMQWLSDNVDKTPKQNGD